LLLFDRNDVRYSIFVIASQITIGQESFIFEQGAEVFVIARNEAISSYEVQFLSLGIASLRSQ
jgi:hypothetical protein